MVKLQGLSKCLYLSIILSVNNPVSGFQDRIFDDICTGTAPIAWIWFYTQGFDLLNSSLCPQAANLKIVPLPKESVDAQYISRRLEGLVVIAQSANMFVLRFSF